MLLTTMLPAGYFDPMTTRVIMIVTLGGFPHVLMDGIVTRQELTPSSEPGQSTLTDHRRGPERADGRRRDAVRSVPDHEPHCAGLL